MTERQKRFSEHYAASANATQSAIAAGYSERSAYSDGQRLLKNAEIQKYISSITAPAQGERIATAEEIQSLWTSLLRDENTRTCDRLTASKLLYAAQAGAAQANGTDDNIVDAVDDSEEENDRLYCLPFNGGKDITALIAPDGALVPLRGHEKDDVFIYLPNEPEQLTRYKIWKKTGGEVDICGMMEPFLSETISKYQEI